MAKDILYIANGITVDAAWTDQIVVSSDGVTWDGINKAGLTVGVHHINLNTTAKNSYPERGRETGHYITVKRNDQEGAILKFNPSNVLNQATWIAGTPLANAQVAMDDLMTWISS